jgi:hypothetical protein
MASNKDEDKNTYYRLEKLVTIDKSSHGTFGSRTGY